MSIKHQSASNPIPTEPEAPSATGSEQGPEFKFPLGTLVATPGVLSDIPPEDAIVALARHLQGDWGDLCPEDLRANDHALAHGLRILSAYKSQAGVRFWIVTEADRSSTCILLPEEY